LDNYARVGWKRIALIAAAVLFAGALAYAWFFALPRTVQIPPNSAGSYVVRIDVSGNAALVVVTHAWVDRYETELPLLVNVLRAEGVERALLLFPNGRSAGIVDVTRGKALGIVRPPQ
jgi:hypothetical protein